MINLRQYLKNIVEMETTFFLLEDLIEKLRDEAENSLTTHKTDVTDIRNFLFLQTTILEIRMSKLEAIDDKICETILQYYNLNVIDENHRNFATVCSLYEFISTGKCRTLDEAYALFDSGEFVTDYNKYSVDTEQLKDSQSVLYSAVKSAKERLESVFKFMIDGVESLDIDAVFFNKKVVDFVSQLEEKCAEYLNFLKSVQ